MTNEHRRHQRIDRNIYPMSGRRGDEWGFWFSDDVDRWVAKKNEAERAREYKERKKAGMVTSTRDHKKRKNMQDMFLAGHDVKQIASHFNTDLKTVYKNIPVKKLRAKIKA